MNNENLTVLAIVDFSNAFNTLDFLMSYSVLLKYLQRQLIGFVVTYVAADANVFVLKLRYLRRAIECNQLILYFHANSCGAVACFYWQL